MTVSAELQDGGFDVKGLQMFEPPFNASPLASVKMNIERSHDGFEIA